LSEAPRAFAARSVPAGAAMQVVNLSELDPAWKWLEASARGPGPLEWKHASALSIPVPAWWPRPMSLRRAIAAGRAAAWLKRDASLLVSHGPRMTMYGSVAMGAAFKHRRHLAYSFNFTELPSGTARRVMAASFRSVDRFVCFSTMERHLYARHFDLDIARIDMIHWAAEPARFDPLEAAAIAGDYICALGSQGRDYATLLRAMQRLPAIKLVLVATPESIGGISLPPNVELRCNVPLREAMNILRHSRFSVVPLRDDEVPCGHVTIVAAMHSGKATIVSDSAGVADYIQDGLTGLAVPAGDPLALTRAIERLWSDPQYAAQLASTAASFALTNCRQQNAIDYFERFLRA
jgi:glycosyltransferase involved in cell wall biosynthesis